MDEWSRMVGNAVHAECDAEIKRLRLEIMRLLERLRQLESAVKSETEFDPDHLYS